MNNLNIILSIKTYVFGAEKETAHWDVSFMRHKHMFDRKTLIIIIFGG